MNCTYNCSIVFDVVLIIVINGDEKTFIQADFKQNLAIKSKLRHENNV